MTSGELNLGKIRYPTTTDNGHRNAFARTTELDSTSDTATGYITRTRDHLSHSPTSSSYPHRMTTTQSQKSPAKVIVDTDPGVDDVLAILLSLASPELDVRLISIVFGNTHAPVAHSNLLKIYHALAQEIINSPEAAERYRMLEGQREKKTVLALGEDGPIGGEKAVAAYFVSQRATSSNSERPEI